MSLIARAVLACLYVFLGVAAASAATVGGTVTDAASKAPLGGMIVAAYDTSGALRDTATTDSAGLYALTISAGDYRVLAYDPAGNYATAFDASAESFETSPVRSIGNGGATIHFALVRGGTITGRVTNASGVARPGATVEAYNLSGTRRGFTTADSLGNYTLVLPPGQYKIAAFDTGFGALFHPGVRTFAEAAGVTVVASVATPNVHFALSAAARVSGSVVDLATRQPLAGIDVYAYHPAGYEVARTTTSATGAFALSLPNGTYRFVAADPNRVHATSFFDANHSFDNSTIVTLAAGEQRTDVQFALVRGTRISGTVNAAGLSVTAYNLDGSVHASTASGEGGSYTLLVAPGAYKVGAADPIGRIYAARFYEDTADFRMAARLLAVHDVTVNVLLPRGGVITGSVPAGMMVAAYDEAGVLVASTTAQSGSYELVVAPGAYRVLAFDPRLEYATSYAGGATSFETTVPVHVAAGVSVTADLPMTRGIRVRGTVKNLSGAGIRGVDVFALDASGHRVAGAASTDGGAFTIVVLPGAYRFGAIDPAGRYAAPDPTPVLAVSESQSPVLTFTLEYTARRRSARH